MDGSPAKRPRNRLRTACSSLLLAAPFVALLAVPSFERTSPRLAGFPFFYWYQLLWVVLTGLSVGLAHLLTRRPPKRPEGGK